MNTSDDNNTHKTTTTTTNWSLALREEQRLQGSAQDNQEDIEPKERE
jgi:hypothetical protein